MVGDAFPPQQISYAFNYYGHIHSEGLGVGNLFSVVYYDCMVVIKKVPVSVKILPCMVLLLARVKP